MKPIAYLTIDLDYWNGSSIPFEWLQKTFASIRHKSMVLNHHEILPEINLLRCTHLVNVDYHSDLGGFADDERSLPELNCGTWVDWVKWRDTASFTWIHPNAEDAKLGGRGRCEGDESDAFELAGCVWKRTEHYVGGLRPRLPDYNYIGVNLCLSEDYLENSTPRQVETIKWFQNMGEKYNLLTIDQQADCNHFRARRPEWPEDFKRSVINVKC